jgi:Circularly permutated YpsA SLOG family
MSRLTSMVSGGQKGADQTALRAAIDCGLECGGWCPPDRQDEEDSIPAEYPLQPTPYETSLLASDVRRSQRTEWNVFCSDATVIFRVSRQGEGDPGTLWTAKFAARFERPCLHRDPRAPAAASEIIRWLADIEKEQKRPVRWLNIAGPSKRQLSAELGESECDRFLEAARAVIIEVVRQSRDSIVGDQDPD